MFMGIYFVLCGILFYYMSKPLQVASNTQTINNDVTPSFVNKDSPSTQGANSNV